MKKNSEVRIQERSRRRSAAWSQNQSVADSDPSTAALAVAKERCQRSGATRVEFHHLSLFDVEQLTDEFIANELVAAGVPKEDIVLGFHAPYKREFTDFAVG